MNGRTSRHIIPPAIAALCLCIAAGCAEEHVSVELAGVLPDNLSCRGDLVELAASVRAIAVYRMQPDGDRSLDLLDCVPVDTSTEIELEAETGTLTAPMVIGDGTVFGSTYVGVPVGQGNNFDGPGDGGRVSLAFTVPETGIYALSARTIAPDVTSDSFFVLLDGELLSGFWTVPRTSDWQWHVVAKRQWLAEGKHVLEFVHREDGTLLDAVRLVLQGIVSAERLVKVLAEQKLTFQGLTMQDKPVRLLLRALSGPCPPEPEAGLYCMVSDLIPPDDGRVVQAEVKCPADCPGGPETPLSDAGIIGPDLGASAPCVEKPDEDTVALYTFESIDGAVPDEVPGNVHPATVVGQNLQLEDSKAGCGQALRFPVDPGSNPPYLEIADHDDWKEPLSTGGSVDFWVRFDSTSNELVERGIVSRDAGETNENGHLTIFRACDGAIVVRIQDRAENWYMACSTPVENGTWHYVGLNLGEGGLELYVDRDRAQRTDALKRYFGGECVPWNSFTCGSNTTLSVDGNVNPWVIGASSHGSTDGEAGPVLWPLQGAVDSLRISSQRRDFSR